MYNVGGMWVYPFVKYFTPVTFGLFVVFSSLVGGLLYCIGKGLASFSLSGKISK